jgi:hypothetical protein
MATDLVVDMCKIPYSTLFSSCLKHMYCPHKQWMFLPSGHFSASRTPDHQKLVTRVELLINAWKPSVYRVRNEVAGWNLWPDRFHPGTSFLTVHRRFLRINKQLHTCSQFLMIRCSRGTKMARRQKHLLFVRTVHAFQTTRKQSGIRNFTHIDY